MGTRISMQRLDQGAERRYRVCLAVFVAMSAEFRRVCKIARYDQTLECVGVIETMGGSVEIRNGDSNPSFEQRSEFSPLRP